MAVKVNNTTVIDDSRGFFPQDITGTYSNFHPTLTVVSPASVVAINFEYPVTNVVMASNVSFTTSGGNLAAGRQTTMQLDRSTSGYTPSFGTDVEFAGGTPTWSNRRHWLISFTCWDSSTIRATAMGFDEPGTVSSTFTPTWSLTNWDNRENDYGTSFEQAWCYVRFQHVPASSKVLVQYASGNTQAMATVYSADLNYTGMSGTITAEAQYNGTFSTGGTTNQASFGPRPEDDGYTSGTYYSVPTGSGYRSFEWMAANNPNLSSNSEVTGNHSSPAFRVKLTSNEGTFYSTASVSLSMYLRATYGNSPGF